MNISNEATDQIVKLTVDGAELALKVTGKSAAAVSKILAKIIKSAASHTGKSVGKTRVKSMLKEGGRLDVYELENEKLKDFASMAKRYGILYTVIKEKESPDEGIILVKGDEREKMRHIFKVLSKEEKESVEISEASKEEQNEINLSDVGEDGFLKAICERKERKNSPAVLEQNDSLSGPLSKSSARESTAEKEDKPSVRAKLERYRKADLDRMKKQLRDEVSPKQTRRKNTPVREVVR